MRARQVPDQLRERLERQLAEAAVEPARCVRPPVVIARRYHVPMHRAQVLQQVRFLLKHRHAESTGEGFLTSMNSEMCFEIP